MAVVTYKWTDKTATSDHILIAITHGVISDGRHKKAHNTGDLVVVVYREKTTGTDWFVVGEALGVLDENTSEVYWGEWINKDGTVCNRPVNKVRWFANKLVQLPDEHGYNLGNQALPKATGEELYDYFLKA